MVLNNAQSNTRLNQTKENLAQIEADQAAVQCCHLPCDLLLEVHGVRRVELDPEAQHHRDYTYNTRQERR